MYKINLEMGIAIRFLTGKKKSMRLHTLKLFEDTVGLFVIDYGKKIYLNLENSVYI